MRTEPLSTLSVAGHLSLPETVYRQLRAEILSGVFKPGDMLRQDDLARRLGVSRAPLREALPRLQAEGIVTLHPRRGYAVVSLDPDEIQEIFELRTLIEERAVFVATKRRTNEDVEHMRSILSQMELIAPDTPENLGRWFDLNFRFHDALVAPSGQRHFRHMVSSLRTVVESYLRVEINLTGDVVEANAEHQQLGDAFAKADAKTVARMTRTHIEHTALRLLEALKQGRRAGP